MKKILMLLFGMYFSFTLRSQNNSATIEGNIIDTRDQAIEYTTIALMSANDSTIINVEVTDMDGKFMFREIPYGTYFIEASFVGFETAHSLIFNLSDSKPIHQIQNLVLPDMSVHLAGVEIIGKKPLVEQKIDRLVINVDAYVSNVGATALEVLERSPGITVSKDGNIGLKGKAEVVIMVDGKPSYLSNSELANLLSSMSSNELSQIEIMTNPSAKYDAAGNAGVINIKTKKSLAIGFNGNLTLSYGQGVYSKSNNSLLLNYKTDKFSGFVNYSYGINNNYFNLDFERNFFNNDGTKNYTLEQSSERVSEGQNQSLKLGFDYNFSKQTSFGITSTGFISPRNQIANTTSFIKTPDGTVTSIEETYSPVENKWKNGSINLNLRSTNEGNHSEIFANVDYLHYDFTGNQDIFGSTYSPENLLLSQYAKRNILPLTIDIYSGRFDYSKNFDNGINFETGLKSSLVGTKNSSDFYTITNGNQMPDYNLSNAFNYSENNNAAYVNLNKNFNALTFQLGLRMENTNYNGTQSAFDQANDSTFNKSYVKLFPTTFVSYEVDQNNKLTFSVGRRIDRPEFRQLNPFVSFLDRYTTNRGNPFLQPQFSTNFELSHTLNNQFTTTLNYSVVHGMINEMFIQTDSLITRTYGNIGTRFNYGISESASFEWNKWYASTFYANLYHNKYDGVINGYTFQADQWTLALNVNNQFSLPNGWSAELSGNYISRNRDEGQAIILPSGQLTAGVSKKLFNDQASLKLSIRDLFYTQNPKEIQDFQNVKSITQITRDTRVVTASFLYKFGQSSKSKSSGSQPTDEQQRVKTM